METEKLVIILIGPPGSGKGTQGGLLADHFNLELLDTSQLLEELFLKRKKTRSIKIGNESVSLSREQKKWHQGELVSPLLAAYLVKKKIKELWQRRRGVVLTGSPRTEEEAKNLTPFLKKKFGLKNIKVLQLKISQKESIFRNSHRKICSLFRHSILYTPETIKLKHCPIDGSKLITRALDQPAIIKIRWQRFLKETMPVLNYLKKQGINPKKIEAQGSVAQVFSRVLKALK